MGLSLSHQVPHPFFLSLDPLLFAACLFLKDFSLSFSHVNFNKNISLFFYFAACLDIFLFCAPFSTVQLQKNHQGQIRGIHSRREPSKIDGCCTQQAYIASREELYMEFGVLLVFSFPKIQEISLYLKNLFDREGFEYMSKKSFVFPWFIIGGGCFCIFGPFSIPIS